MTFEGLTEFSPEQLAKLTDADLNKILEQYFPVTRPELAPKPTTNGTYRPPQITPQQRAQAEMLKELGLGDAAALLLKGRKK